MRPWPWHECGRDAAATGRCAGTGWKVGIVLPEGGQHRVRKSDPVVRCQDNASIGDPMAKLSMHEDLPFDEATAPPRVSTGDLPRVDEVRRLVTEAYERYRGNDDGTVA